MMRKTILFLPVLLAGCATFFPNSTTYTPVVSHIDNATQYAADLASCHKLADNYHPGFSIAGMAQSTVTGATDNAAYAPINPLVPAAGAAGGLASSAIQGAGLNGAQTIKILVKCVVKETERDRSALVADPNE